MYISYAEYHVKSKLKKKTISFDKNITYMYLHVQMYASVTAFMDVLMTTFYDNTRDCIKRTHHLEHASPKMKHQKHENETPKARKRKPETANFENHQ